MKKYLIVILPIVTFGLGFALRGVFQVNSVESDFKNSFKNSPVKSGRDLDKEPNDSSNENRKITQIKQKRQKVDVMDTVKIDRFIDSMIAVEFGTDSLIVQEEKEDSTIHIKRDRMIHKVVAKIRKKAKVMNPIDSLKSSGMEINDISFGSKIQVEFWESPFNYTGYKLGKTKLVLYGFDPKKVMTFEELGKDSLLFKDENLIFKFAKTQDFKTAQPQVLDSL